ncbi:hypothetical protein BH09ACT8_BH09ACT8_59820 [soil metagenome]
MDISMRSMLTAGVTAVTAASIVAAPSISQLPGPRAAVERTVELSAAAQTLTQQEVSSALVEIGKLAASTGVPAPATTAAVSAANPLNAASDAVVNAYNFVMMYADYVALQLAPYVLQFLPFGWVITDQIYAIYPPITDFTDSVVYDLVAPVINDPLNLAVWANGISAVTYSAAASVLNVAINEVNVVINYFLGFLPPLPPIPPWPSLAAPSTAAAPKSVEMLTTDVAQGLAPGLAKPLARASKAAPAPIEEVASDVATTAKTVADTAATDLAAAVTPVRSAAPAVAGTATVDTTTTAPAVAPTAETPTDVGVVTPPAKASRTAKAANSVSAAAVSGAKKALKSVTKAGKTAKSDKSAGSAAGGE